jgi:hypothetical protein
MNATAGRTTAEGRFPPEKAAPAMIKVRAGCGNLGMVREGQNVPSSGRFNSASHPARTSAQSAASSQDTSMSESVGIILDSVEDCWLLPCLASSPAARAA